MNSNAPRLNLAGTWEFRPAGAAPARLPKGWRRAQVPGNVHTDLMALGDLPDPHLAENEADMGWVEECGWDYRRRFELTPELEDCPRVFLRAEGLDTWAELRLNGKLLGTTDNAFVEHEWEVRRLLKPGANEIAVRFKAPLPTLRSIAKRHGYASPGVNEDLRTWARKPQYSFGWDWGPRLVTSGIYKAIQLLGAPGPRISDLWLRCTAVSAAAAEGSVEVEVDSAEAGTDFLKLRMGPWQALEEISLVRGRKRFKIPFKIARPQLWWPQGYGLPTLYQLEASLLSGAQQSQHVGLRRVELERKRDRAGESFGLKVNGVPVFCRGANWIPVDTFLGRSTPQRVAKLIGLAREAGMNMLRVWGGGLYESEDFYSTCDRLGLLVWQDFPFACSEVPEEPWFLRQIEAEARKAVSRLRRHPSLALWCGNNENHQAVHDRWFGRRHRKAWGEKIYHRLLPALMKAEDPERPYWPGSPYGGANPNDQTRGDRHNWEVWAGGKDFLEYRKDKGRFLSEFGFAALPNRRTLERAIPRGQRSLGSRAMEVHDKVGNGGYNKIAGFMQKHLPLAGGLDDFRYLSQVLQAEALATGVEHWRRLKPHTQGAIFWQLNDCWPVSSWAVVDGSDTPKLAWHRMRGSMDPLLLSAVEAAQELSSYDSGKLPSRAAQEKGLAQCWLSLDGRRPLSGTLTVELWDTAGRRRRLAKKRVAAPANASKLLWQASRAAIGLQDAAAQYLVFSLEAGPLKRQAKLFFERPRRLKLEDPGLRLKARRRGAAWELELSARRLALGVELHAPLEGRFADNGFDLLPGEKRRVAFEPSGQGRRSGKWEAKTLNAIAARQA